MAKGKEQITIYPKTELYKKIEKEAEKQHRSVNNLILYFLEQTFKK